MDASRSDDEYQLLPPLSSAEYESLKEDIQRHGVRIPIVVDEDGGILAGHHRWRACQELGITDIPTESMTLESEEDKHAFVYSINLTRRQLSPEQMHAVRDGQRDLAERLRGQGKSHQDIAEILHVARSTVSGWLDESNVDADNALARMDLRLTIPKSEREAIVDRANSGNSHEQVAADYKVTPQRIGQIVKDQVRRRRDAEADHRDARSGREAPDGADKQERATLVPAAETPATDDDSGRGAVERGPLAGSQEDGTEHGKPGASTPEPNATSDGEDSKAKDVALSETPERVEEHIAEKPAAIAVFENAASTYTEGVRDEVGALEKAVKQGEICRETAEGRLDAMSKETMEVTEVTKTNVHEIVSKVRVSINADHERRAASPPAAATTGAETAAGESNDGQ